MFPAYFSILENICAHLMDNKPFPPTIIEMENGGAFGISIFQKITQTLAARE